MVINGLEQQVKWLNCFPVKGGVSITLSPRTIITGKPIDYNKQCTIHMGAYVLVHTENQPTNTMAPRALSCIYLNPMDNMQGGHELLNLATNRIITCMSYTEVPLTNITMERVHYLAERDKMLSTLTFLDRKGDAILDYDETNGGVIIIIHHDHSSICLIIVQDCISFSI